MSSDNYFLVRRTRDSRFVALMAFKSDDLRPTIDPDRIGSTFASPELALESVADEYSEYCSFIDPECFDPTDIFETRFVAEAAAVVAVGEHLGLLAAQGLPITADGIHDLVEIVDIILVRGLRERIGALEERLRGRTH